MLQIENIFNVSFSKQECTNFITVCNIEKQYTKQGNVIKDKKYK